MMPNNAMKRRISRIMANFMVVHTVNMRDAFHHVTLARRACFESATGYGLLQRPFVTELQDHPGHDATSMSHGERM